MNEVKISFSPHFSSKVADLAENVRLKRQEIQATGNSLLLWAGKTGNKSPEAKASNSSFGSHVYV